MRIIILGPPGSGKGTQARMLSDFFKMEYISTGDMFREEISHQTELGSKISQIVANGNLVPDQLVNEVIKKYLTKKQFNGGYILDGYPRTIGQAKFLEDIEAKMDCVLYFNISDKELINRITLRRVCPNCKTVYHLKTKPPQDNEKCDICKVKLFQRKDDNEETVKRRLQEYHGKTEQLLRYYRDLGILYEINASQSINEVFNDIVGILKR